MCRELIITFCLLSNFCFAQADLFRGCLYEQNSCLPIRNAHIRVKDTDQGTVSGQDGTFDIQFKSLPSILEISCLGYESLILEISKIQKSTVVLFLKPKTYDLNTLTVSDKFVITLYKDEDYSVLDYNFLGDNLMLLVFRYQLRRSELVLMTTDGDTLSVVPTPAVPPLGLYKDVLSNLHSQGWLASVTTAFLGDDQWRWKNTLLQDEVFQKIYAVFTSGGFIGLKKIDLETGNPGPFQRLPFVFPEKIKIFKGEVYFLSKDIGPDEKWKLFKVALR